MSFKVKRRRHMVREFVPIQSIFWVEKSLVQLLLLMLELFMIIADFFQVSSYIQSTVYRNSC